MFTQNPQGHPQLEWPTDCEEVQIFYLARLSRPASIASRAKLQAPNQGECLRILGKALVKTTSWLIITRFFDMSRSPWSPKIIFGLPHSNQS